MKRLLACVVLALLLAGCGSAFAPIPPRSTPSPIVLATALTDTWTALQQVPLQISTLGPGESCPVVPGNPVPSSFGQTVGNGPLYLVGFGQQGIAQMSEAASYQNGLYAVPMMLVAPPAYAADMLARGRQMDGPTDVRFSQDAGADPLDYWQLFPGSAQDSNTGWLAWDTYLEVSGPGCYGLQIDGAGFSEVIVFQIIAG